MAGNVFPQTLGPPPEPQWSDPYAAQIEAMRARMQQPQPPMYSPEEQQARLAQNAQLQQLGLLGQLSGNEALGNVGGTIFKQALAARQPRVSDKGVADPLTGKFNYHPDYLRERDEAAVAGLESRSAADRARWDAARAADAERRWQQQRHDEEIAAMHRASSAAAAASRAGNEPLVQVFDPESGQVMYLPRSQAVGLQAPPKSQGNASEGERNAAGFAHLMTEASKLLDNFESKGIATVATQAAGAVPLVGGYAQRTLQTPAQQQYNQAAQAWVRAKLRKESGASIGKDEMAQEIATYFPMPGDRAEVITQKRALRALATQSMVTAAGRVAVPQSTSPGEVDVGAALRGNKPPRKQALPRANPQAPNPVVQTDW
jgi:hypothetical protein